MLSLMWSYHALCVSQCPSIMEESIENQGVGVEGYHEVSKCQTHHKHITWRGRHRGSYLIYIYSNLLSYCEMSHRFY